MRSGSSKIVFAAGAIGPGALFAFASFYLLYFYTDVVALPAGVITAGIAIGRLWDIVNDPLVGWLSDRSRSGFGRRRVFIVGGAVPLVLTTIALLWIPPNLTGWAALAIMVTTYFLWDASLTAVHVPYYALGVETFDQYDQRTSIVSFAAVGALFGYVLGGVGIPLLAESAGSGVAGYRLVGVALGALSGATIGLAGLVLKEPEHSHRSGQGGFRRALVTAARNRSYVRLLIALGLTRIALTLASASLVFFVVNRLGENEVAASKYVAILLGGVVLAIPFWRWFSQNWDKAPAYRLGLTITAAGLGLVYLVPEGGTSTAAVAISIIGLGSSSHWILPWSMIPDTTDRTPTDSGTGFGLYGVVEKVSRSLALVAVSWTLAIAGYQGVTNPSQESILAIRLLASLIPAGLLILAVAVLSRYPISRTSAELDASR